MDSGIRVRVNGIRARDSCIRVRVNGIRARDSCIRVRDNGIRARDNGIRVKDNGIGVRDRDRVSGNHLFRLPIILDQLLEVSIRQFVIQVDKMWHCYLEEALPSISKA
jgi:hypothetical protein